MTAIHFVLPLQEQAALTTLLTQPHRHYHNTNHVNDCLAELYSFHDANRTTQHRLYIDAVDILTYAIWYHDAIYNPYAPAGMNEEQSAALFGQAFKVSYYVVNDFRWDISYRQELYNAIKHAIRATAKHTETQKFEGYPQRFEYRLSQLMLDIDLAGFGKPPEIYAKNSINIRKEYYNTTEMDFLQGRLKFLQKINQRESLYYTEYFRDLYHKTSKENIGWEIESLQYAIACNEPTWYLGNLKRWVK